jgi:hypothetical protein
MLYIYIYIANKLTPWSWVLLEMLPVAQLLKIFPTLYVTRRPITVFTRALHWFIPSSLINPVQTTPSYFSKISINIILLRASRSSWWSISHQYPICMHLLPMHATCPAHPPWFDHSNYTWRRVQVMRLLINTILSKLLPFHPSSCCASLTLINNILSFFAWSIFVKTTSMTSY